MLNQLIRYIPIIKFVNKNKPVSICEIGSGSYGIGKFLDINFIGIDTNFEDYSGIRLKETINPKMKQIIGSAKNIPLRDSSIDLVFSLDTFEHINETEREESLKEILRVAKNNVIIGFPCGVKAEKIDRKISAFYTFFNKKIPLWLIEHLENKYPEEYFLDKLIEKYQYRFVSIKNENNLFHFILIITENIPILRKILFFISKSRNPLVFKILSLFNFKDCYRKIYFIQKNSN